MWKEKVEFKNEKIHKEKRVADGLQKRFDI